MDLKTRTLPPGFARGQFQGQSIIGEVTESLHRFLLDGWTEDRPMPRIEEDLSFVPKDREEVIYIYMYNVTQNTSLMNGKHWRPSQLKVAADGDSDTTYYERPALYLDLRYMICVHSRFRSDAERLLGWCLLRLHEATHLVYRPKRYLLPNGQPVDSTGAEWSVENEGDNIIMEKVSLAWVDDFTLGDAINFFTIHEAPFRPYLTYMARCAMDGSMVSGPMTTVRSAGATSIPRAPSSDRPNGRTVGRQRLPPPSRRAPFGPAGKDLRKIDDTPDSED